MPDVILLDIQMPELDGIEVTRRLRTLPEFASSPIIAVTALAMSGDRERFLALGMTDYVSKPLTLDHLTQVIQRHLPRMTSP